MNLKERIDLALSSRATLGYFIGATSGIFKGEGDVELRNKILKSFDDHPELNGIECALLALDVSHLETLKAYSNSNPADESNLPKLRSFDDALNEMKELNAGAILLDLEAIMNKRIGQTLN